jgi:hypothetical protein
MGLHFLNSSGVSGTLLLTALGKPVLTLFIVSTIFLEGNQSIIPRYTPIIRYIAIITQDGKKRVMRLRRVFLHLITP